MASLQNYKVPRPKWPRHWEESSYYNLVTGSTQNTVSFDLNLLFNDIAAEARTNMKRAYVTGFAFLLNVTCKVPGGIGQAVLSRSILLKNLEAVFDITTSTPNFPNNYYQSSTNFSYVDIDARVNNPDIYSYIGELDVANTRYPEVYSNSAVATPFPGDVDNVSSGSALISGKPRVNPQDPWGCASSFIMLNTNAGGLTTFSDDFVIPMPVCIKSGAMGYDPVKVDRLPLEVFSSPNQKAIFTISPNNKRTALQVLTALATGPVQDLVIDIALACYIDYDEHDDPYAHGVTWQNSSIAINAAGGTIPADFYRLIAIYPQIIEYKDPGRGGASEVASLMFKPFDWNTEFNWQDDGSKIQWNWNGADVFPGKSRPYLRKIVQAWAQNGNAGTSYKLYYDKEGVLFCGTYSGLGSPTVEVNDNFTAISGYMTFMPIFPLAFTNPAARGFAPGFMCTPGEAGQSMQIQIMGTTMSDAMITCARKITMAGSQNWILQENVLRQFEVYGQYSAEMSMNVRWNRLLDSTGPVRATLFEPVLPSVAKSA